MVLPAARMLAGIECRATTRTLELAALRTQTQIRTDGGCSRSQAIGYFQLASLILDPAIFSIPCRLDKSASDFFEYLTVSLTVTEVATSAGRFEMCDQSSGSFEKAQTSGTPIDSGFYS